MLQPQAIAAHAETAFAPNPADCSLLEATAIAANTLLTTTNFDTAVNTALKLIGEALGSDRVNVIENTPGPVGSQFPGWRVLEYEWNSPGTPPQHAHPAAAQGSYADIPEFFEQFRQGNPLSYIIEAAPEPFRSTQIAIGVKSTHIIPIVVEGQWWGVLGLDDCREAKRRHPSELAVLKIAADCIGSAIQREQAQQAALAAEQGRNAELEQLNAQLKQTLSRLSESESRYRQLMELASEGIFRVEYEQPISLDLPAEEQARQIYQQFRYAEHNLAFAKMYGCGQTDALVGTPLAHVRDAPENAVQMEQFVRNGHRMENQETVELDRFGRKRFFLNNGFSIIQDGQAIAGWGTQIDITELRETQQALLAAEQQRVAELATANAELQQRDRLLEAATSVANRLLTINNLDEAINQALQILGQALDTDRFTVIECFDPPGNASSLPHWRVLYEWVSAHTRFQLTHPELVQGNHDGIEEWYRRLSQGHSISCALEDVPEPFRSGQAAIGVKAMHIVPILIEGRYWGAVGFDDCREAKPRSSAELAILRVAADCIGSAIQRDRHQRTFLQAEQERVAELANANTKLQRRDRLLAIVADITKDLLENSAVEAAVDQALQRLGETAQISRVAVMQETSQEKHRVIHEWTAPGFPRQMDDPATWEVANGDYACLVEELHAGQSIWHVLEDLAEPARSQQAGLQVKSTGAVPIFIEGQYFGCVGFDDCVARRQWSPYEIDVLTSGAGAIGAALHRQQLVDQLVAERLQSEQERVAELAKANQSLKRSLAKLGNARSLNTYLEHILREALRMLNGTIAQVFLYDSDTDCLRSSVGIDLQGEFLAAPGLVSDLAISDPFPAHLTGLWRRLLQHRGPIQLDLEQDAADFWPGTLEWHRQRGNQAILCVPLLMGDRPLGLLGLASTECIQFTKCELEFIQALAQQATLAIQLTQLAEDAKQAAILDERNRLAREVHDTLAQAFTGVLLQLEATKRKVGSNQLDTAQDHITRARHLAQAGLSEARRSVRALRPQSLESQNLPDALQHLACQMTADSPVQIQVEVCGTPHPLAGDIEDNLLRIAQEALTNALRHASPQTVQLQLNFAPSCLHLQIQDDGCGFEPTSHLCSGFGLASMQERSHHIGGDFSLTSRLRAGTKITVTVPLTAVSEGKVTPPQ